jgi:GAF domain-containing protein/HAMP domain-containing protein
MDIKNAFLQDDIHDGRLRAVVRANSIYAPSFAVLAASGLAILYLFSRAGLLGQPVWQIMGIAAACLFMAGAYLPIERLTSRGRIIEGGILSALVTAIFAILITVFWAGMLPLVIVLAWILPGAMMILGIPRRFFPWIVLIGLLSSVIILFLDFNPPVGRLQNSNPLGLASFAFLAAAAIIITTVALFSGFIRFRTLRERLLYTFAFIVTVPIIITSILSALTAYTSSLNQFDDTLQAISAQKEAQINSIIVDAQDSLGKFQQGLNGGGNMLYILQHRGEDDDLYKLNFSLATNQIRDFLVREENKYDEILILDAQGVAVLSNYQIDENLDLSKQELFTGAREKDFTGIVKIPTQLNSENKYKLVISGPLFASDGKTLWGVIVLVEGGDAIGQIMDTTPGLSEAETYLVSTSYHPLTKINSNTDIVNTVGSSTAITNHIGENTSIYRNYAGQSVLGHYHWFEPLQAAFVAEIPQSLVFSGAFSSLRTSAFVGLFAILLAMIALIITSRSISQPISELANTAEKIASGQLTARARTDREDEIGDVGRSFNAMAQQLQEIIGTLEQRVASRTEDLERQALRLRVAAEVARDAASAQSLSELLDRSSRLIRDRFNLYHTGIFLLDENKEYAVLRASPTEAGKEMMANNHRLRIGEQGIVGRVAATGEPRIALDTGADSIYFSNPLLPSTHSEMALPLKSNEDIIGVLDVQSDQPEAFTRDDIAVMQVMADQLATAIGRTRLLQQVETNLLELERTYGEFTKQSWKAAGAGEPQNVGYKFNNIRMEPFTEIPKEAKIAIEKGITVASEESGQKQDEGQLAAIPIRLRGQVIGVVNVRFQGRHTPQRTIAMIEQAADRLATALENARLIEETRQRAQRDSLISGFSNRVRATLDLEAVLKTAAQEIQQVFQLKEAEVRLGISKAPEAGDEIQDKARKNGKRRE